MQVDFLTPASRGNPPSLNNPPMATLSNFAKLILVVYLCLSKCATASYISLGDFEKAALQEGTLTAFETHHLKSCTKK